MTTSLQSLIDRFQHKQIHAAQSGRALMEVLVGLVRDKSVASWDELDLEIGNAVDDLLRAMPAYAPPINVMHRFLTALEQAKKQGKSLAEFKSTIDQIGVEYSEWSRQARKSISSIASELVPQNGSVFTFTLSETVLTTLQNIWADGKRFRVFVTESRPNNDGLDTAKRLASCGVPVTISIDACIPDLINQSDLMLSGAEAILASGSAICKAGTFLAALAAQEGGVPLFVLADTMKFDVTSLRGIDHPLDPIATQEFSIVQDGVAVSVGGHLFDRTPPKFIRGIVTERGLISPVACTEIMVRMPMSELLVEKVRTNSH